jgi:tetratricopeptide (TPR) repeat protein
MMRFIRLLLIGVVCAAAAPSAQELGTISFPTSGAPSAQPAFLEGVKALHSFQFDEAADAFRRAQKVDPDFALAFWGEAMSHNHPLWAQQDVEAAKKALEKLAPTHEARIAKAKLPKEKAYLEAMQTLYFSPGEKLARDHAYSEAMARLHAQWPDDHEIATFYALSLLGTVRPGDAGFRRQARAASIAMKIVAENPKHPGAAHFIIHAFDDPEHAILALPAANEYARIAPAASHALHMPSHIYVQLGMWQQVTASNTAAYKAAARPELHSLSWLMYANLMLGQVDEAQRNVETARQAAERDPGGRTTSGYLGMRARHALETGRWEKMPLDGPPKAASDTHAHMPGMSAMPQSDPGNGWVFVAGVSAVRLGDQSTAQAAEARLRAARKTAKTPYAAKEIAIFEKELAAIARLAAGQREEAVRLAKEAVDIEMTTDAPSGPPDPMKPASELYGDVLLEVGRPAEAASAYAQSLLRTPKRTPSLLGLARASARSGNMAAARQHYTELATMPGAAPASAAVQEAQKFLKAPATDASRQ